MGVSEHNAPFDPAEPLGNDFIDALLGLERAFRALDAIVPIGPQISGDDASAHDVAASAAVDAVLGLLSLRRTFGLLLDAVLGEEWPENKDAHREASWRRDVLR